MNKIIFITTEPLYSKTTASANRLQALAKGMFGNGYEIEIWGLIPSKFKKIVNNESTYINRSGIVTDIFFLKVIGFLWGTLNTCLRIVFLKKPCAIIVYQNQFFVLDFCLLFFSKLRKILFVMEFTEPLEFYYPSKLIYYFYRNCILKNVDAFYVISNGLKNDLKFFNKPIEIINMVIDLDRYKPKYTKEKKSVNYIGYCGSINQHKDGLLDLVEAFSLVAKRHRDVRLKLAGDGPLEFNEKLKNRILKLGITDKVDFINYLNAEDVVEFTMSAAILVLARPKSLQAQLGFPTKLGEYLASGNPVVTTDTGEIKLFLENNLNAIIIEPGNIVELSNSISGILDFPENYIRMGLAGNIIATEKFNNKIEGKKLINFVNKLLKNDKRK